MTITQEDAFYDFLENRIEPFTPEDVIAHIRKHHHQKTGRLAIEITSLITARNIAFRLDSNKWLSRRGCFESAPFVINPTRLELLNGILIPGHRCIPFANPMLLPHNYTFFWKKDPVKFTAMEGSPEEFYPYYSIFGEEYAPQYVARDNPENEEAFNYDPYEDPPEVSIQTLDMRNIYRESGFVPGDRFLVTTVDWKEGRFTLERVAKQEWSQAELEEWRRAAETGFHTAFKLFGPGGSTEEQIAFAYWYGGTRMRAVPAYALEDFLYEKTDVIETAAYGIETRFWYAGKEIPDRRDMEKSQIMPDQTMIEEILFKKEIPISEYAVNGYIRDALFRNDLDVPRLIERIVPPSIELAEQEWGFLAAYIIEALNEIQDTYVYFSDQRMGPIRQRVSELHTAVIDLIARLQKGDIDSSWLPRHTFIILSQIQTHAANVLEDLDADDAPPDGELETLDNSVDSMIETYEDMKAMIDEALNTYRLNNLSLVKPRSETSLPGRILQISIGGADVWRRIVIPETVVLEDLHRIIQTLFGWKGTAQFRFLADTAIPKSKHEGVITKFIIKNKSPSKPDSAKELSLHLPIADLGLQGIIEISYEYGTKWTIKLIMLARLDLDEKEPIRCVAGEGAAPPESVDGPVRFRKYLGLLENGTLLERQQAVAELGDAFDADAFDIDACNRELKKFY
ncbi:MAG: plasmid pRiA4b ORF-3 family protein [Spirochaetaceae bacterium]|jgi:hypothetical protein|nr:plasmid pRiA4b ORF-3 family protein [Spirochaetaceae bacterium]